LWTGEGHIFVPKTNIGFVKTTGIDINTDYGFGIGRFGDIDVRLVGTYVDVWELQELPGAPIVNCVGVYISLDCERPRPEWASNLRTTWMAPSDNISVSLLWRYVGDLRDESGFDNHLPSMSYVDLFANWQINDQVSIRLGANNLFDDDPPIASFGSGNTVPEAYDALGRYLFTGITIKL
jgi:iron complex outermembrane receptor protein